MRVSVSLSICTAILVGAATSSASALDADEMFNRFKAQAAAQSDVIYQDEGATRGLAVSYGAEPKAAPAPRTAPAAVVPTETTARPFVAEPNTYVTVTDPLPAASQPTPSYTIQSETYDAAPSFETVTAPAYVPADPVAAAPGYTVIETPAMAIPVATAPVPGVDTYNSVADEQRVDLRIFFEWNSASLKPEAVSQLAELCTAIRRVGASPENRFKIIGHTDKSGSKEYNLYLSNARAKEVKRHLVEECALPASALVAVGEGERQSSPTTPANAPEERRVEIQLVS